MTQLKFFPWERNDKNKVNNAENIIKLDTKKTRKPVVLDLFCGCGGFSLGFQQAGFEVIAGIDNDKGALFTLEKNLKKTLGLNIDLSRKSWLKELFSKIGERPIDVIIAGPPCQGFSLTGPRNFDDPRNSLYLAVLDAVKFFKPTAFIIENVKGMKGLYNGAIVSEICSRIGKLKYNPNAALLNASNYGVPQFRDRFFIVGLVAELGYFSFPTPTHNHETYVSCEEAIGDLPSREYELGMDKDAYEERVLTEFQQMIKGRQKHLFNHVATNHKDFVKEVISMVPEGGNYKDLPQGIGESRKFNEAWTRYHSQKPSRTIDTGHRNHFHYKYNRVPTIRENARLQTFPDSFIFYGSKTVQNRLVGNAVPPMLGQALANKIKEYVSLKSK
jgi:DNA (cytosine-5)-methyltransferase 1